MNARSRVSAHLSLLCGLLTALPIAAGETVRAGLAGIREVPVISTGASGSFRAVIDDKAGTIAYELRYSRLEGDVQQAHIHVGQRSVNGSVSVFLCQTEASPDPTGLAPRCPPSGKVTDDGIDGAVLNRSI